MKILLLGSKEYPFGSSGGYDKKPGGGIEIHVEKLAKYLAKRGNNVFIITRLFPGQKKTEKKGRISVYRTKFIYNKFLRAFTFNAFGMIKAEKLIKENKIDIIHCHGPVAGLFGSILSKATGVPMVFTPHGTVTTWSSPIKEILKMFEMRSVVTAKKTIFVSSAARKELTAKKNFHSILLANGIDMQDFPLRKKTWKETRFLFLGRLEEVKGIKYMLQAYKKLQEKHKDTTLFIAGDGDMKNHVLDFIKKNRLQKRIKFLGWVKSSEWLSKTDVFLLPSWEKGQPVALLEAMATGKLIITSLEYIKDMVTGIKTKPNADDLYKKMEFAYKNFRRLSALGKNARKDAKKYEWNRIIDDYIKAYKSVISKV